MSSGTVPTPSDRTRAGRRHAPDGHAVRGADVHTGARDIRSSSEGAWSPAHGWTSGPTSQPRRRLARRGGRDEGSAVELAAVMIGVFGLVVLLLALSVRWLAAEAASAAAHHALEIAQSPDGTVEDARQVAERLATSVRVVTDVEVTITRTGQEVSVTVTTGSVLGGGVTVTATGPLLRFVPQQPAGPP